MKEASKNTATVATTAPTAEEIEAWKKKYGQVYLLETYDDKIAYVHDPYYDLLIMKKAVEGLKKSAYLFTASILNDCWLAGDYCIKTDEKYINGLEDDIDEITRIPDATHESNGNDFTIHCEGECVVVERPTRKHINAAERANTARDPFETEVKLFKLIAKDKTEVERISRENKRAYIGMLVILEKLKDKVHSQVKKL